MAERKEINGMKELAKTIGDCTDVTRDIDVLQEASKKWSCYELDTFADMKLSRALAISEAIANFTAEF